MHEKDGRVCAGNEPKDQHCVEESSLSNRNSSGHRQLNAVTNYSQDATDGWHIRFGSLMKRQPWRDF